MERQLNILFCYSLETQNSDMLTNESNCQIILSNNSKQCSCLWYSQYSVKWFRLPGSINDLTTLVPWQTSNQVKPTFVGGEVLRTYQIYIPVKDYSGTIPINRVLQTLA